MVDRWVHGRLEPTCQEGCPKFVQEAAVDVPGGAANAERCLSRWEVETTLCCHWWEVPCLKTRFVDPDDRIVFRHDLEGRGRGGNYDSERVRALEWAGCASGVLLSDYDKGFLTPEFIRQVADLCRRRGVPCVADCKRAPSTYAGCILKGNEEYWRTRSSLKNLESGAVITGGSHSPWVTSEYSEDSGLPPVKCVNHVGAGDCFAAHLTLALACGFCLKDAAAVAHSAGRVYVQHRHNRPPSPGEVVADVSLAVTAG